MTELPLWYLEWCNLIVALRNCKDSSSQFIDGEIAYAEADGFRRALSFAGVIDSYACGRMGKVTLDAFLLARRDQ